MSSGPELPDPEGTFPGTSAAASHAAWPSHRQPMALQWWPLSPSGLPERCWKTSALQDIHLGWGGRCTDLTRTSAQSSIECHESCAQDPLCSVWQYSYATTCWQGVGRDCPEQGWRGTDLFYAGGQRIQHGDITVLKDFSGWQWEVLGLRDLGDTSLGSANHTAGAANCRKWCYSNVACQYWQYAPGSCKVEDPRRGHTGVDYPLVLGKGATQYTDFAVNVIAGEFIAHSCPPEPAPLVAVLEDVSSGSPASQACIDGAAILILSALFAAFWLRMRGYAGPKLFRTLSTFSRESALFRQESGGLVVTPPATVKIPRSATPQIMPTPISTILMPGSLDTLVHKEEFATPAECDAIKEIVPGAPRSYCNYLAWRRVCVASLLILGVFSQIMQFRVLLSTWEHHISFQAAGRTPHMASYEAWLSANPANPGFFEYTKDKSLTFLAGIVGEVLRGTFFIDLIVCTTETVALVILGLALLRWTSFARSRRMVMRAWASTFITAFLVSLFPMRLVLSFKGTERQADVYVHELAVALNLDKAQDILLKGCAEIATDHFNSRVQIAGETLQKTCGMLAHFPIELAVPCMDSDALCHIDLGQALEGCKEAAQQFEIGHVEKATAILQSQCVDIQTAFSTPNVVAGAPGGVLTDRSRAFEVLVDMLRMPFHAVVPSIEVVSVTVSALHAVLMVLPQVIAIGPGLMVAALVTKVLAPHSCLPGTVMTVIPMLTASFGWLIYTVLFQYVSHRWTLALLVLVVMFPCTYIGLVLHYRMTLPVHNGVLRSAARTAFSVLMLFSALIALCVVQIVQDLGEHPGEHLSGFSKLMDWCHVSWGRLGLACAVRTFWSYALTCFGAADWMLSDVSAQQRYWSFWARRGNDVLDDGSVRTKKSLAPSPTSIRLLVSSPRSDDDFEVQDITTEVQQRITDAQQDQDLIALLRHRDIARAAADRGTAGVYNDLHTPTPGASLMSTRFFLPDVEIEHKDSVRDTKPRVTWGPISVCREPTGDQQLDLEAAALASVQHTAAFAELLLH